MKVSTEITVTLTKSDIYELILKKIKKDMVVTDKTVLSVNFITPINYDNTTEGEPYFDSVVVKYKKNEKE